MGDEYADILGTDSLPIRRTPDAGRWSSLSFVTKTTFALAFLLILYLGASVAWAQYLKWREKNYKLSLRRKHGIPDNDHRPFNVAWAAARTAREDQEKEDPWIGRVGQASASSHEPRQPEQLRHRSGSQRNSVYSTPVPGLPGRFNPSSMDSYASIPSTSSSHLNPPITAVNSNRVTFADGYNTSASPLDLHAELSPGPSRRINRKNIGILKSLPAEETGFNRRAKRTFDGYDEQDGGDNAKKTRLEGDELIDGDEEAEWQFDSHPSYAQPRLFTKGSKRGLVDEYDDDSDVAMGKRQREKRARKVSADKYVDMDDVADDMVVDDEFEDHVRTFSRGRKRDRAEAGSSIGGEEENGFEDTEEEMKSRRRKRQNQRKSDIGLSSSRGSKRHRDVEEEDEIQQSDDLRDNHLSLLKSSKKKKANKKREEEERISDISMDDSLVGGALSSKGRRIGEEWESNGQKFKIGPNGQRLRMALVKKARQKFVMPVDSIHPDRKANVEVYIETWLTEEEYREAKEQRLLSWQESPPASERHTPSASVTNIPKGSPPRQGKHLLWESTATPPVQPLQDNNPFIIPQKEINGGSSVVSSHRQSIATAVGLSISPFPSRRIASAFRNPTNADLSGMGMMPPSSPGLADSTNSLSSPRMYRQFSKWEKQDLEAKAMMRMREVNKKKEEEKKANEEKAKASALPSITLTKPPEEQAKASTSSTLAPPTFSLPGQTASNSSSTAPKLSFGVPPPSSSTSSTSKPPTPAVPSFSFAKPDAPASAAPVAPSIPTAAPSAPTAAPNASPFSFGVPGGSKPQEKPAGIGFGFPSSAPATSSATPSTSTPALSSEASATAPKFSFGIPPKPATTMNEQNKDAASSTTGAGSGPSFSRLAPAPSTPTSAPATQGATSTPSTSTQSPFTFAKPSTPASSAFGMSSNPAQNQSQSQSSTTTSTAAAPSSGLKFSFGVNTANKTGTPATSTPSSLSGALGPSPFGTSSTSGTTSAFGSSASKSAGEETGSGSTGAPVPLFSFGTPKKATALATSTPGITDAPKPAFSFPSTSSGPGATPSPFGSAVGVNAPKAGNAFGASVESTSNVFGSNALGSKVSTESKTEGVANPSPFGSGPSLFSSKPPSDSNKEGTGSATGGGAFSFGGKPAQSAFPFGSSSTPPTTLAAPSTTAQSAFRSSSTSSYIPSSSATIAPKSVFGTPSAFGGSSTSTTSATPSSAAPSAFSFDTAPSSSSPFAAAAKPGENKSSFSFGTSSTPASGTSGNSMEAPKSMFGSASEGDKKPTFSFGTPTASTSSPSNTTNGNNGFSFKPSAFGTSGMTSSPFGASANGGQSAFGGFGTSPTPSTGTSSTPANPFAQFADSSSSAGQSK